MDTAALLVLLRKIADSVPALVGYVDAEERYQFANRTYGEWLGVPYEGIAGRRVSEVWDAARYAAAEPHIRRALAGERVEFDRDTTTPQGARVLRVVYVPDSGADGTVAGFFILSSDITEEKEARRALGRARKRLDMALQASRVAVWETDLRKGETVLSEAWAEILEHQRAETRTTVAELAALVHPEDLRRIQAESMAVVRGERAFYAVEHRVRAGSGHWKWILSRGEVVERDPVTGAAQLMMGTNLDITDRKRSELRLETLANYDSLTGCANRNLFTDRLTQVIARCKRSGQRAALLYLDVDRFKGINDTLGHDAGDAVLREFSARLKAAVRQTDTVGRIGGDEFAVLLEEAKDAAAPERVAQKIIESMHEPVSAGDRSLVMTTSIGIALFGGDDGMEALARRADRALYDAKAGGRNTYRVAA